MTKSSNTCPPTARFTRPRGHEQRTHEAPRHHVHRREQQTFVPRDPLTHHKPTTAQQPHRPSSSECSNQGDTRPAKRPQRPQARTAPITGLKRNRCIIILSSAHGHRLQRPQATQAKNQKRVHKARQATRSRRPANILSATRALGAQRS